MDWITALDFNILHFIHNNISCGFMDFLMPKVTFLGEMAIVWLAAAAVMLFFRRYRRGSIAIAGGILGCLLVGNLALKHLIARARPCWIETDFPMLIAIPKDFSFPSGHSMVSFAAAVVIFHYNRKLGIGSYRVFKTVSVRALPVRCYGRHSYRYWTWNCGVCYHRQDRRPYQKEKIRR
mgnify:CR=1 FL=1